MSEERSISLERSDSINTTQQQQQIITTIENNQNNNFDLKIFQDYLIKLLPLLLGSELNELFKLFQLNDFNEKVLKWANDSSLGVVYIVKTRDEFNIDGKVFSLLLFTPNYANILVIIK